MSVPHRFGLGDIIEASAINENFEDILSRLTAIEANQLLGQITADKLTDRYSIQVDTIPLIDSYTTATVPASATGVFRWEPLFKPGKAAFLSYIKVYIVEADAGGGDSSLIDFRVNGATVLGSSSITLSMDHTNYIVGTADPLAAPLYALAEGDYVEVRHWAPTGSPEPRGLYVTFALKHVLIP